jgi:hypothetical protein
LKPDCQPVSGWLTVPLKPEARAEGMRKGFG